MTELIPVDSSWIVGAAYDPTDRKLRIRTKTGATYDYLDVEARYWDEFVEAPSKGGFINREIKGRYECRPVVDDEVPT